MDASQTQELPAQTSPDDRAIRTDSHPAFAQCDQCGTPADDNQRYCVVCGNHLRNANDPASRYFSQATARSRAGRPRTAPARARRSRSSGLGIALALALIPVAAAVGITVGRSSNNGDAALVRALSQRPGTVTVAGAAGRGAATRAAVTRAKARSRHRQATSKAGSSAKGAGKVISKTKYGSAQQISGFKATKSEEQQGAQATQKVQKSTGKNYVNSQSNLPSQVVVP